MKEPKLTQDEFINEATKIIIDGVIDIDERINTRKVEVLVRKTLKRVFKHLSS